MWPLIRLVSKKRLHIHTILYHTENPELDQRYNCLLFLKTIAGIGGAAARSRVWVDQMLLGLYPQVQDA